MISFATLLTLACVCAAADHSNRSVSEHISSVININRTLPRLESDKVVNKLNEFMNNHTGQYEALAKLSDSPVIRYDEERSKDSSVEESPDYASSVVLASDILALTSAVANIEEQACREQGFKFLDGLLLKKRWALKMFDASSKSPQGLLFGSTYHLGSFDECITIKARDDGHTIEGQYCLATLRWKKKHHKEVRSTHSAPLRWAVCVPGACSPRAVASFVSDVLATAVGNTTNVTVTERDCYTNRPLTVNKLDIWFLSVILLFVAIFFFATIYEAISIYCWKTKSSMFHDAVICFSGIHNMKKILSTSQNNSLGLDCVAGIKALAMMLIVASHACLFIGSGPVIDFEAWNRLTGSPFNGLMTNNMLLVDTFLFLSAFLFSRLLLIELDKRKGKLNVLPIIIFRYIRITPAYAVVLLFYMTWLPKIGEGPLWKGRIELEQERCMQSWWTNILHINNYVNTKQMCMFQSWYLSVDTQLFIIAPIFIFSLWRWRRIGPTMTSLAVVVAMVVPGVLTFINRWDPTFLFYVKEFTDIITNNYFNEAYIKTHMKMTVYFMGILTGYILHRIQTESYEFSGQLKIFGWVTSTVLGTVTVFSVSIFYQPWYHYNSIEAAAYQSLHKLAWGIANGWLVIACATGNGGLMNKFFCWKFLLPISRLTFCAYLVNGIIELYYVGTLRHPLHITFFTVMANGLSHMILTFFLALLLCLLFESPLHGLEKILIRLFVQPVLSDHARNVLKETSKDSSQSRLDM